MPGRAGADPRPRATSSRSASSATSHREKARLEPRYAELDLRRPLVLAAEAGARRVRRRRASSYVTGEVRLRLEPGRCVVTGRRARTASTTTTSPPTTPTTRFRHEDSAGFVRLWGLGIETWARRKGQGVEPAIEPNAAAMDDPLARPLRRGPGRRAAGASPSACRSTGGSPPTTSPARAPTCAMLGACGLLDRRGGGRRARPRSTASRTELAEAPFAFAPTDEDIHTAIERRVTELAGAAGRQAAHRPQPQRPGRDRPAALYAKRRAGRRGRRGIARAAGGAARSAPTRPATPTCPATRTSSAPSRCCSRTTCSPTSGRSPATSTGCSTARRRARRVAPRRRRARRLVPAARSRRRRRRPRVRRPRSRTRLDAVSDRDFVAEALFALALLGVHLSRIGEEIVLWSTEEFGFLRLADAYATGTSMLPQKKNPDIAELARGKAGPADRRPHRLARHAQGPAARVQPRPPGGQGAAVRRPRQVRARRSPR